MAFHTIRFLEKQKLGAWYVHVHRFFSYRHLLLLLLLQKPLLEIYSLDRPRRKRHVPYCFFRSMLLSELSKPRLCAKEIRHKLEDCFYSCCCWFVRNESNRYWKKYSLLKWNNNFYTYTYTYKVINYSKLFIIIFIK